MRIPRRHFALVMACSVGVASAQPAQTSPPAATDDRARALDLFRESDVHYKRGEFEKATELLRAAYALHAEPLLLYNLARALEGMGDFTGAIEHYERYLAVAETVDDRGAIERRIATLRVQVARATTPSVEPIGTAPPVPSHIAPHRGPPAQIDSIPPRADGSAQRIPWVIAGVGGLIVGAGAGFGYVSQVRHQQAVDAPVQAEADRLQRQARTWSTAANVAFVAGGVTAVAGLAWALYARRRDRAATVAGARVSIGDRAITATWVFE